MPIGIVGMFWHMTRIPGLPLPGVKDSIRFLLAAALSRWLEAFLWGIVALFLWRKYRRWGRVPRVLMANREGLNLSYLGWWRMRRKHWPASEITAVEIQPVRGNVTWWKPVADLRFMRIKGSPLSYRLSSKDSQLPGGIAERFRSMLGGSRADVVQSSVPETRS